MSRDTKNLIKRGSIWWFRKTWKGQFYWFSLQTENLGNAQERRDRVIQELRAGKWGDQRPRTINEAMERFVTDHFPTLKPKSQKRYALSMVHLVEAFDGINLQDISSANLKAFENKRRNDGVSTSTIRRDLACLSSIFSLAEEEEWVKHNPVKPFLRGRAKKGLTEGEPRTRYLSHYEEDLILGYATPKPEQAITFAIDTGLRLEEQFGLLWSDVDLAARLITVRAEVAKSLRARRVPILPRTHALLTAMAEDKKSLFVFTSYLGNRYSPTSHTMYDALQRAVRKENRARHKNEVTPMEHVEWHDLRRTCGCRLLNDYGYDINDVSKWLGHSSVTVTERSYAFLYAERLRDKMDLQHGQVVGLTRSQKNQETYQSLPKPVIIEEISGGYDR